MGLLFIGINALLAGLEANQRDLLLRRESLHFRQNLAEVKDVVRTKAVDGGLEPFNKGDFVYLRADTPVRRDRDGGAIGKPLEAEVVGAFIAPRARARTSGPSRG